MQHATVEIPVPEMDDVRRVGRSVVERFDRTPRLRSLRRRSRLQRMFTPRTRRRRVPAGLVIGLSAVSVLSGVAAVVVGVRKA
jgi:hypothetical protein